MSLNWVIFKILVPVSNLMIQHKPHVVIQKLPFSRPPNSNLLARINNTVSIVKLYKGGDFKQSVFVNKSSKKTRSIPIDLLIEDMFSRRTYEQPRNKITQGPVGAYKYGCIRTTKLNHYHHKSSSILSSSAVSVHAFSVQVPTLPSHSSHP